MDCTRKARWVLDGHKLPTPQGSTYAGVVSRESVRIVLTYTALNGLEVCAADIRNAYLQAPSSCKDYIICGPEFGVENEGMVALIHRALYGGNAILSAVKARVRKKTHKYGIEGPTNLVRAKELDRINGNTLWIDALKFEMHNVGVAFEVLEDGKCAPQGWMKASGHIIWDLKMDFTRKARWVLDGHKLPTP
jgi:hypothetical protein